MRDSNDPTSVTLDECIAATTAAKARAEAVLRELHAAQAECDAQLQKQSRTDPIRLVTGRSSLDVAIANTKRMIDSFDRALHDANRIVEATDRVERTTGADIGNGPSKASSPPIGRTDPLLWIVPTRARAELA